MLTLQRPHLLDFNLDDPIEGYETAIKFVRGLIEDSFVDWVTASDQAHRNRFEVERPSIAHAEKFRDALLAILDGIGEEAHLTKEFERIYAGRRIPNMDYHERVGEHATLLLLLKALDENSLLTATQLSILTGRDNSPCTRLLTRTREFFPVLAELERISQDSLAILIPGKLTAIIDKLKNDIQPPNGQRQIGRRALKKFCRIKSILEFLRQKISTGDNICRKDILGCFEEGRSLGVIYIDYVNEVLNASGLRLFSQGKSRGYQIDQLPESSSPEDFIVKLVREVTALRNSPEDDA